MHWRFPIGIVCLIVAVIGCEIGPQSGIGLRLPDGDPARGERTFASLGCFGCHVIAGEESSSKPEGLAVTVVLGGRVDHIETHGELVTSIINPSHGFPRRYPREAILEEGLSKMTNFNDAMTVEQLIDLTAYLQSKYELDFDLMYGP